MAYREVNIPRSRIVKVARVVRIFAFQRTITTRHEGEAKSQKLHEVTYFVRFEQRGRLLAFGYQWNFNIAEHAFLLVSTSYKQENIILLLGKAIVHFIFLLLSTNLIISATKRIFSKE